MIVASELFIASTIYKKEPLQAGKEPRHEQREFYINSLLASLFSFFTQLINKKIS